MRARKILIALAAGSGAIFALLHILGADRPHAAPPAATAAEREPPPGPAADAAPAPEGGAGTCGDSLRGTDPADVRAASMPPGRRARPQPGQPRPVAPDGQDPEAPLAVEPPDGEALSARLTRTRDYREFLRTLDALIDSLPMTIAEGGTHGHLDQDTLSSCLIGVLDRTTDPVVRQHLIFHIAVFLPADTAFPRLRSLATGDGGGDAEDALCALAFRGDPDAVRGFQALALRPAPVDCHRLVGVGEHDCLAEAGERELLRAWRCIEALQGNPYFALHDRVSDAWRFVGPPPEDDALAREILPAWLVRYEGHPGSDDMALRLSRIAWTRGNAGEAIRWASRAATLPDADVQGPAAALLAAEAEQAPLTDVLPDPGDPERNRNLLSYVRLRRIAVERGFAAAFDELRTVASREPRLPLSECFRHRLAEPPPRGVAGGAFPPAGDDPLLRIEGERLPDLPLVHPLREFDRGSEPTPRDDDPPGERDRSQDRLLPSMEPVRLPPRRLAFQFRCWETLAELERRADRATSVEASADLVYRQGAILFHERDALFPLQAPWRIHGSGRPWPLATAAAPFGEDERDLDWCRRNLPRLRAADLFERVLGMGPASPVAERAAYSLGLSLVMAAREPPLLDGRNLAVEIPGPRSLLEGAVEAFDRCARENPGSPLGLDAAGLAARWRERLRREIDE